LLLAQRTADEAIAQAQSEAEGILTAARTKASTLESEAQAAHLSRVTALEQERSALENEIAALRNFEREFRTRLKAYLETQLNDLQARPSLAPAPPSGSATTGLSGTPSVTLPPTPAPPASLAAPPPVTPAPAPPGPAGESGVPPLAPPASPAPQAPPAMPPRPATSGTGPFSAAPAPGIAPSQPGPLRPAGEVDTDVDAASDALSRPPAEAGDDDDGGVTG
jgi:TolA-binding protein